MSVKAMLLSWFHKQLIHLLYVVRCWSCSMEKKSLLEVQELMQELLKALHPVIGKQEVQPDPEGARPKIEQTKHGREPCVGVRFLSGAC
jgi:hypothetical protein